MSKLLIEGGIIGLGFPFGFAREVALRTIRYNAAAAGADVPTIVGAPPAFAPVLTEFSPGHFGRLEYPVGRVVNVLGPGKLVARLRTRPIPDPDDEVLAILLGIDTARMTPGAQVCLPGVWWVTNRGPLPPGVTQLTRLDLPDPSPSGVAGQPSPPRADVRARSDR